MDNDLILADAQGTPAGYGDTVQYILDKLGEEQLGPDVAVNGDFVADTDWTKETGWSITGGVATKAAGTAGSIYQGSAGLSKGDLCQVKLTVSGRTAGTLTPFIRGTHSGLSISADGTYTVFVLAGTDSAYAINLYADASFDGNVESISVRELKGTHAHQTSASLKPARGRVPVVGRRNLLTNSFELSAWSLSGATVGSSEGYDAYFETATTENHSCQAPGTHTITDGNTYIRWGIVKPIGRRYVLVGCRGFGVLAPSGNPGGSWNTFDTQTGEYVATGTGYFSVDMGNGFWLLGTAGISTSADNNKIGFAALDTPDSAISFAGDPAKGLIVQKAQYEPGSTRTSYQRVTSDLDVYEEGQQHIEYLRLDHTDDKLLQTFPDGLNGDLVVCGTKGSWVDRGVSVAAGGDLEIGPVDLPQTPGVLPALGDIIGWVPVNKTLTEEEWRRVVDYYKGRGAKGQLVPSGVELITNGTFDTDLIGWTEVLPDNVSASWENGAVRLEWLAASGGLAIGIYQTLANLSVGASYLLSVDVVGLNGSFDGAEVWVDNTNNLVAKRTTTGRLELCFTATVSNHTVRIGSNSSGEQVGDYLILDNASVQELIPEEDLA